MDMLLLLAGPQADVGGSLARFMIRLAVLELGVRLLEASSIPLLIVASAAGLPSSLTEPF